MNRINGNWKSLTLTLTLSVYGYVFMEWLFDITKPSFMNTYNFGEQVSILLGTAALAMGLCLLASAPFFLLGLLPASKKRPAIPLFLASLLPAAVVAALVLMVIDNFTYTLFHYGIVSSSGLARGAYGLLFLALWAFGMRTVAQVSARLARWTAKGPAARFALPGLAAVLLLTMTVMIVTAGLGKQSFKLDSTAKAKTQPNILFVTSDGVSAVNMSAYGYERDTTPRIKELAQTSLFAENAFTNAGKTTGSIVSLLNGRYPTQSRMLFPPDILTGANTYQHLPGILNAQGYKTVQFTVTYYADAYAINLINGFDIANGRAAPRADMMAASRWFLPPLYNYFIYDSANRLADRLRHIFYLKTMVNPIALVTNPGEDLDDHKKLEEIIGLIRSSDQPLFIQVHFMVTHGATFWPDKQVFSAGQAPDTQKDWTQDFYDDSILQFDQYVGILVDELKNDRLFDDTILFVGSDHAERWNMTKRIPLMIHFPNDQYAGRIEPNTQIIDVAPTVLDYIGIRPPDWMQGRSLLNPLTPDQPIFTAQINGGNSDLIMGEWVNTPPRIGAPFYQFGSISMIYCNRWYLLSLSKREIYFGAVEGSTVQCRNTQELTDDQAIAYIKDHLKKASFDTASLSHVMPVHDEIK